MWLSEKKVRLPTDFKSGFKYVRCMFDFQNQGPEPSGRGVAKTLVRAHGLIQHGQKCIERTKKRVQYSQLIMHLSVKAIQSVTPSPETAV